MTWQLIKGVLMAFAIFVAMGISGNIIGGFAFSIFTKKRSDNINSFLKVSIFISFIIGAIFFYLMGMFYASYTLFLTTYMTKWIAIILVVVFLLLLSRYTFKEVRSIHEKNVLVSPYEFYNKGKYSKHGQVVNENVLLGCMVLFPSYIFFLLFNNLADRLSFGLNSWLMSLIK